MTEHFDISHIWTQSNIEIYYHFWSKIIKDYKIDFIFHEPTSLFMNHIASILYAKYGAAYVSPYKFMEF